MTGAGGSDFLVASAFTCTNCTACGFCTPAAGREKRPRPTSARRDRKAATLAIESLAVESLAVENWDKDILQRGNLFLLCAFGNVGCQLRPAKRVTACRTWAEGWFSRLRKKAVFDGPPLFSCPAPQR